jgi:hypothetical protein
MIKVFAALTLQALTEADLYALSRMPHLAFLRCEDIIIPEAKVSAVQIALASSSGLAPSAVLTPLPCLGSIHALRLTGLHHRHNGLLGLIFPVLESLELTSVEAPSTPSRSGRGGTPPMAALPCLRSLSLPSCKALPSFLGAAPSLIRLFVSGINCQQRLEELLRVPAHRTLGCATSPPPGIHISNIFPTSGLAAEAGWWWPESLSELSMGFSSSLRFRPKQIAAAIAEAPACVVAAVTTLMLRDRGNGGGGSCGGGGGGGGGATVAGVNDLLKASEPSATMAPGGESVAGRVIDDSVLMAVVKAMTRVSYA